MDDEKTIVYTAVYDNREAALADLETLEALHDRDMLGKYDAAVIDREDGKPHIVKRVAKPAYRIVPELFSGGSLPRKELHEAADELTDSEARLIVVGEPTLEKAFDEAITRALKTAKRSFGSAADDLVSTLKS
jgi:hypothetical protein